MSFINSWLNWIYVNFWNWEKRKNFISKIFNSKGFLRQNSFYGMGKRAYTIIYEIRCILVDFSFREFIEKTTLKPLIGLANTSLFPCFSLIDCCNVHTAIWTASQIFFKCRILDISSKFSFEGFFNFTLIFPISTVKKKFRSLRFWKKIPMKKKF